MKQLEDGYVRFVALSFFFLCAKFCPFDAGMSKLQQMIKWDFLGHGVHYKQCTFTVSMVFLSITKMPNTLNPIGLPLRRFKNTFTCTRDDVK